MKWEDLEWSEFGTAETKLSNGYILCIARPTVLYPTWDAWVLGDEQDWSRIDELTARCIFHELVVKGSNKQNDHNP